MVNTLGYRWEYAYSHPIWAKLGIRREYERIPTMLRSASSSSATLRGGPRDAWWAAAVAQTGPSRLGSDLGSARTLPTRESFFSVPKLDILYVLAFPCVDVWRRECCVCYVLSKTFQELINNYVTVARIPITAAGGNTRIPTPREPLWEYVEYVFTI